MARARGLSQRRLADLAGTSNQEISLLEHGKRGLTDRWMHRLASVLGCDAADVLAAALREFTPGGYIPAARRGGAPTSRTGGGGNR